MRLDRLLVERGLARSRTQAARAILAGRVRVDGQTVECASFDTCTQDIVVVGDQYVSRAAWKLVGALDESGTQVPLRVLDAGASTGGFTQVLLERGAERVYAVDVGHGQLSAELRADPRVVNIEGLNLRSLNKAHLDNEAIDLIVGDVSFISLTHLLQPLGGVLAVGGVALLLVKPQFEVGRERLGRDAVVTDQALQAEAVDTVVRAAQALGLSCDWRGVSQLPGKGGNVEFFIRLRQGTRV